VKFLVDNQLPTALADFLRKRGLDCQHVVDVGLAKASDLDICRYATDKGRIIVSKDEDFLYLASQPKSQVKLLWVRLGNCRTKALIEAFERVWPKVDESFRAGDRTVELR